MKPKDIADKLKGLIAKKKKAQPASGSKFDLKAVQEKLKNYDWRRLKKYTKPQAADDLNIFLEKMPQNAGQTMLIMAAVAWSAAGAVGLFTTVQMQKMTELRIALQEAQALKPSVPEIVNKPVNTADVREFVESIQKIYTGLEIKAAGATISLKAKNTNVFGQFREAVGHVQNGGKGWRVSVENLCVGRECERHPLSATLKVNTVSVKRQG